MGFFWGRKKEKKKVPKKVGKKVKEEVVEVNALVRKEDYESREEMMLLKDVINKFGDVTVMTFFGSSHHRENGFIVVHTNYLKKDGKLTIIEKRLHEVDDALAKLLKCDKNLGETAVAIELVLEHIRGATHENLYAHLGKTEQEILAFATMFKQTIQTIRGIIDKEILPDITKIKNVGYYGLEEGMEETSKKIAEAMNAVHLDIAGMRESLRGLYKMKEDAKAEAAKAGIAWLGPN